MSIENPAKISTTWQELANSEMLAVAITSMRSNPNVVSSYLERHGDELMLQIIRLLYEHGPLTEAELSKRTDRFQHVIADKLRMANRFFAAHGLVEYPASLKTVKTMLAAVMYVHQFPADTS